MVSAVPMLRKNQSTVYSDEYFKTHGELFPE